MNANVAGVGALTLEQMQGQLAAAPDYRVADDAPARRFTALVERLWGGSLKPLMAAPGTGGRFSEAPLACPATASTGLLDLPPGARSEPWRNADAIENIVALDGGLDIAFGPALDHRVALGPFDMFSVPAGLLHQIVNRAPGAARAVICLSVPEGGTYDAVFDPALADTACVEARRRLGLRFEDGTGIDAEPGGIEKRVTRFDTLVPYKKDLNRTGGLPAEATESLSAGSVYPLIVPEGHVGRSRTAPMYGHQGLYISIAECSAGNDGPPPHAHSDTQESFFVLDGSFDMCTGFDNETVVPVKAGDLIAMPKLVMRTFRNTAGRPSRLLVIIQGPGRMQDTVSFSRRIGEDFERRFGRQTIEEYAKIRMTFDAEERLGA